MNEGMHIIQMLACRARGVTGVRSIKRMMINSLLIIVFSDMKPGKCQENFFHCHMSNAAGDRSSKTCSQEEEHLQNILWLLGRTCRRQDVKISVFVYTHQHALSLSLCVNFFLSSFISLLHNNSQSDADS